MDEQKKQYVKVGLIISCLVLAIGIFFFTRPKSASSNVPSEYTLKCANPKCGDVTTISRDEYLEKMRETGPMMMPGQQVAFQCEKCNKKSCFVANTCEECGEIFFNNYQSKGPYDKCPKCGYSKSEEKRNKK